MKRHGQKVPQSPTYQPNQTRGTHIRMPPTSFLRIERTWRVNVPSGRQRQRPRRYGGGFVGGSEGIAAAGENGRYTHRSLPPPPLAIADTTPSPSPMQNHPLSRSMGNYFLSVDYGVNFRTTRPDHFERDTTPIRDVSGKGGPMNLWRQALFVTSRSVR